MKIAVIRAFALFAVFPHFSFASSGASSDALSEICGNAPEKLLYRAHFEERSAGSARKLTLVIGQEIGKDAWSAPRARILEGTRCEAVCVIRRLDPQTGLASQSMDLDCRSPNLGHLVTPATVLWASPTGHTGPLLRFGTWLKGYAVAPLSVEIDHFRPKPPVQLAQTEK